MDLSGTSLEDLQRMQGNPSPFQPSQPMYGSALYTQPMQQMPPMPMQQMMPQPVMPPPGRYPPETGYDMQRNYIEREVDASDVDTLDDYVEPVKKKKKVEERTVPDMIREPLLILVLYVVLSQRFVRDNVSKYLPQIEPDSRGEPKMIGIVIYGTILATLFFLSKRYLLPKLR